MNEWMPKAIITAAVRDAHENFHASVHFMIGNLTHLGHWVYQKSSPAYLTSFLWAILSRAECIAQTWESNTSWTLQEKQEDRQNPLQGCFPQLYSAKSVQRWQLSYVINYAPTFLRKITINGYFSQKRVRKRVIFLVVA